MGIVKQLLVFLVTKLSVLTGNESISIEEPPMQGLKHLINSFVACLLFLSEYLIDVLRFCIHH